MNRDLASDLAYLEGQVSVALRHDTVRKLKCKEGYVQRGNACQKVSDKKAGDDLARTLGAGLGAAALVGGAAAIAAKARGENRSPAQGILESAKALTDNRGRDSSSKAAKAVAITVGSAATLATSYMGVNALDKKYQIKEKALLSAYAASLDNSEKMDSIIDQSKLGSSQKVKAKNLVGATKAYLARSVLQARGFDLADVDKENNSFTYRNPKDKSVVTVGSAGSAVITFRSNNAGDAKGFPKFDMAFQVNESFAKKEGMDRKQAVQIIKMTKAAFKKHLDLLPDDALLSCEAFRDDGAGTKRQSIYEKEGFAPLPGLNGKYLFAVKNQGKFSPIPDSQKKHIAGMLGIRTDSLKK